jgi:transcriptional regulator GlxA family with amidase domain
MAVGRVTAPLLDAFDRLVGLLDQPADAPILAPLIEKEIVYRLLVGEQGARLRQIAATGSHSQQIARTIGWLQANFTDPVRVEELAKRAGMSASAFHHHFRAMTAMTPLQYQKWLRLNEARRLMLTRDFDAATASFRVGYGSPSQFSREYRRLFGAPPLRDIRMLQHDAGGEAGTGRRT